MSGHKIINDCFFHDKDRMRHDEVLELLQERLHCIVGTETIDLNVGLGRILAKDIVAPHDVPLHNNAAVDGYAYRWSDQAKSSSDAGLAISTRIAAGDLNPGTLKPGTAVRIFTGASMPQGADTVAMQEDCEANEQFVVPPKELSKSANCRKAGEDLKQGDVVLKSGTRLKAADLCALASIGYAKIRARSLLKVALFSNGNEIRVPGETETLLQPGEVYDANQPLLSALCSPLPIELHSLGIIEDSLNTARTAIANAASKYDVIITTAGRVQGERRSHAHAA